MADKAIYAKMIAESAAAADADLGVIGKKRGGPFEFKDAKPYVDAVTGMKPGAGQSKEVFDLHVQSVNAHYDILDKISVNNTIRAEDDPFVEHYQTGPMAVATNSSAVAISVRKRITDLPGPAARAPPSRA